MLRSAIAFLAILAITAEEQCLTEDCSFTDDTSFLQDKIQVSQRLATNSVSEMAESEVITPNSNQVDKSTFGTRVVHFPPWIYIGIAVYLVILAIHEWFVYKGMKPLGVRGPVHLSWSVQIMGLWNSMAGFMGMTLQIPISLDFALSLNRGATESGLFLSAGIITGLLAMVAGKWLVDETRWNQRLSVD